MSFLQYESSKPIIILQILNWDTVLKNVKKIFLDSSKLHLQNLVFLNRSL